MTIRSQNRLTLCLALLLSPLALLPNTLLAGDAPAAIQGVQGTRLEVDRLLRDAAQQQSQGNTEAALSARLAAADLLQRNGFERDQVTVLREMTLDPEPSIAAAGSRGMAEMYYAKYLLTDPRDAQWLLEALAWAHYSGDEALLKTFTARKPDKAHENIDERGKLRGLELKADDQLYLASEMIRLNKVDELRKALQNWSYPIDRLHSVTGASLLHSAVWYKKTGIARMLVEEYHANVNVTDRQNDTPLDYAEYQQADELIKYFMGKQARRNKAYGSRGSSNRHTPGQPTLDQLKQQNPDALKLPPGALAAPPAKSSPEPAPAQQ